MAFNGSMPARRHYYHTFAATTIATTIAAAADVSAAINATATVSATKYFYYLKTTTSFLEYNIILNVLIHNIYVTCTVTKYSTMNCVAKER